VTSPYLKVPEDLIDYQGELVRSGAGLEARRLVKAAVLELFTDCT
jgi:hypothetical protein